MRVRESETKSEKERVTKRENKDAHIKLLTYIFETGHLVALNMVTHSTLS